MILSVLGITKYRLLTLAIIDKIKKLIVKVFKNKTYVLLYYVDFRPYNFSNINSI